MSASTRSRRPVRADDRGAALLWAALVGSVLGALALLALHSLVDTAAGRAHDAAGAANVAQIVHAARVQQVVNGTTLHEELASTVGRCGCGVALDPARDVLSYRDRDTVVSVDVDSGARSSAPAAGSTLPEFSRPAPELAVDLGGR